MESVLIAMSYDEHISSPGQVNVGQVQTIGEKKYSSHLVRGTMLVRLYPFHLNMHGFLSPIGDKY